MEFWLNAFMFSPHAIRALLNGFPILHEEKTKRQKQPLTWFIHFWELQTNTKNVNYQDNNNHNSNSNCNNYISNYNNHSRKNSRFGNVEEIRIINVDDLRLYIIFFLEYKKNWLYKFMVLLSQYTRIRIDGCANSLFHCRWEDRLTLFRMAVKEIAKLWINVKNRVIKNVFYSAARWKYSILSMINKILLPTYLAAMNLRI